MELLTFGGGPFVFVRGGSGKFLSKIDVEGVRLVSRGDAWDAHAPSQSPIVVLPCYH